MLEPRIVATSVSRFVDTDGPRSADGDAADPFSAAERGAGPGASVVRRAMFESHATDDAPAIRNGATAITHSDASPVVDRPSATPPPGVGTSR